MKESQEIVEYLEIDSVQKSDHGSRLTLTKEGFTVVLKATCRCAHHSMVPPQIRVEFIPPKNQYED